MKALFVHDAPFCSYHNKFYSQGFPYNVWERYLSVFQDLVVVGRGRKIDSVGDLSLSSGERVVFKPFFGVTGGADYIKKKRKIKKHLVPLIRSTDVVVVRLPSFFGGCAIEICKALKKPYCVEVVGCAWDSNWNYGSLLGNIRAPFSYFRTKHVVKNARAVIYVTEHFLQKRYPTDAKIQSFASDVCVEDFQDSVLDKHQAVLKEANECYRLAMLANLNVKYKGFEVAFKAIAAVKDKLDKPIELLLFGGGDTSYIQPLIERYGIQDNVKVMGLLSSGQEVFEALDSLDLYLQPSLTEGLPRAVIEAMSRACPVLASSAGGIPELLDDAYLHKPGDDKTLGKQLVEYLSNQDALLEMSRLNFIKSKQYMFSVMETRRREFWSDVKKTYKTAHEKSEVLG